MPWFVSPDLPYFPTYELPKFGSRVSLFPLSRTSEPQYNRSRGLSNLQTPTLRNRCPLFRKD
jgi:hypothetical protein